MQRREDAFCIKCTAPLRDGMPHVCKCAAADSDRTVLVKAVFCESCKRELYIDEKCNCLSTDMYVYCEKCGKKLHIDEKCACFNKLVSSSTYFGKAGDL
jgi:hypothetical protein